MKFNVDFDFEKKIRTFKIDNIVVSEKEYIEKFTLIENNKKRVEEIKRILGENDWIINKVFLGEWEKTDQRFIDYLELRKNLRNELDELESV